MRNVRSCFLVDDDPDDLEFFKDAVKHIDPSVECVSAPDCETAKSLLESGRLNPDLLFLDLNLPRITGKEFLSQLKKDQHLRSIPVIIYSTSSSQRDMDETLALGASRFLTKPSSIIDLRTMLSDVFRHYSIISDEFRNIA